MCKCKGDTKQSEYGKIHGLLLKASHLYVGKIHEQLIDSQIHPGQAPMLKLLGWFPGLSQKEIAQKLHVKAPTVTVSLQRLEKSGLIKKAPDSEDQRIIRIYLTNKGEKINKTLGEQFKKNEEHLFHDFKADDICLMKNLLEQLIENIKSLPGGVDREKIARIMDTKEKD
jgi:Transcriptional regulators